MTIRALIEAVERGSCPLRLLAEAGFSGDNTHRSVIIRQAFNGSLDAAISLHEALLPDTKWVAGCEALTLSGGFARIVCGKRGVRSEAFDQLTAARALLLAILRAVEADGQQ